MVSKRPICPSCSTKFSSWGRTTSGKKRYGCRRCLKTRIYQKHIKKQDLFSLFKQYVLWGLTYQMLSSMSGYSLAHLVDKFHEYLNQKPPESPLVDQSNLEVAYLLLDGLWFGRYFVLMVYRQSGNLVILHISVAGREVKTKISKDLKHLLKLGYRFSGIVSDGGTGIVAAVEEILPHAPHQICLAHMHRDIVNCLGKNPKDTRVKQLKILADLVWLIESKEALRYWHKQVKDWSHKNFNFLQETRKDADTGKRWYIHKGARKALRILLKLPKTSFTFLDHPLMPKTTNELEASFGHLGKRWLSHRGLKRERWENFMNWFVYFYNQEKLAQSNRKNAVNINTKS